MPALHSSPDPNRHQFSMEGERQPPGAVSSAVSKVLDDDDLLIEILLHVGFPTTLVCTALVCKHWLQHVSDPKFLQRFCTLHPPALLGFYVNYMSTWRPVRFIPMLPQPQELTAVIRRASFSLESGQKEATFIKDIQNGRVFTKFCQGTVVKYGVYNPLFPERDMSIIPPFPSYQQKDDMYWWTHIFSVNEGDDLSYLYVLVESNKKRPESLVHVYMLRPADGVWRTHLTLATGSLSNHWDKKVVLIDNKIYMPGFPSDIVIIDLMASSFSTIRLPPGVDCGYGGDTMFSRADDASGVYLIQTKELQLRIWLHKGDNWLMVDTISLAKMCANLRISDCPGNEEQTAVLRIKKVGDNVEFVFLQMGRYILYLDIKYRTLRKVYETDEDQGSLFHIYPFKMIWPPTFPPLKDEPSRNTM